MVFSVNSIITAIGMAEHIGVMIAAVILAIAVMYVASGPVAASSTGTRPRGCWRWRSC